MKNLKMSKDRKISILQYVMFFGIKQLNELLECNISTCLKIEKSTHYIACCFFWKKKTSKNSLNSLKLTEMTVL